MLSLHAVLPACRAEHSQAKEIAYRKVSIVHCFQPCHRAQEIINMAFNLLPGKVVVVTGCSTGIGRAIAIGMGLSSHKDTADGM